MKLLEISYHIYRAECSKIQFVRLLDDVLSWRVLALCT